MKKKVIIIISAAVAVIILAGVGLGVYFGVFSKNTPATASDGNTSATASDGVDDSCEKFPISQLFYAYDMDTIGEIIEDNGLEKKTDEYLGENMFYFDSLEISGLKKMTLYYEYAEDGSIVNYMAFASAFIDDYVNEDSVMGKHTGEEMKAEIENILSAFGEIFCCDLGDNYKLVGNNKILSHDDITSYEKILTDEAYFDFTFKDADGRFLEIQTVNSDGNVAFKISCDYDIEVFKDYIVDFTISF